MPRRKPFVARVARSDIPAPLPRFAIFPILSIELVICPLPSLFRPVISFDFPHSLALLLLFVSCPSASFRIPVALLFRTRASLRVSSCPKLLSRTYYAPAHSRTYHPPLPYASRGNLCCARIFPARARARTSGTRESEARFLGVAEEEGNGTEEKREEDGGECDETLYRDMTVDLIRSNRSPAVSLLFRKSSLA